MEIIFLLFVAKEYLEKVIKIYAFIKDLYLTVP